MKTKQILKIITDVFMTVLLLLLMAYSLIGEAAHEWLGVGVFLMFVLHHILNIKWCRNLFRGKYPPIRIFGTALAWINLSYNCRLELMNQKKLYWRF